MSRHAQPPRHSHAHSIAAVDEDVAVDLLDYLRSVRGDCSVGSGGGGGGGTCSSCATDTRKIHAMLSSDLCGRHVSRPLQPTIRVCKRYLSATIISAAVTCSPCTAQLNLHE